MEIFRPSARLAVASILATRRLLSSRRSISECSDLSIVSEDN